MIYSLGIDISKDDFAGCLQRYNLREQTYQVIARKTFKNKLSGFKACMRWLARHTKKQPAPSRVTMEATGVYYESLALYIQEHHHQVHLAVVLPSQSNKFIESQGHRSKTDKIDAYGLSQMGAERKITPWKGIDPFWRELRSMTRTRCELLEQRTQLRNQLHALSHSGQPARTVEDALKECIQALSKQINNLTGLISRHLKSRDDLKAPIACMRSIHGIGDLTIASILAETNGFAEFHRVSQLISFSGYDVVIKQSGKWCGQEKISKKGSKYIRKAMYMPASTIVRCEKGPVYHMYKRLLAVHNIEMKAHVTVQKKLLTYMYVLWNKQEPFDPAVIADDRKRDEKKIAPSEDEATVDTSHANAS
jgi:transposase